ncbi:MAG: ATP-binding protein [Candidatus Dadabacteria bacterium]|nr:ATP-binding protein [Candidatus Dadabacteria bacterium]
MSHSYFRWQRDTLKKALETRRVLLLCGARQCGKTTLAKELVSRHIAYRTLDDPAVRQIAETDPRGFVKHSGSTLIIDEVQRAPDLLSAIKIRVDEDTRPGQYLLTGSADIQSSPGVRESLAGRIRKVRLRPLTYGEILGASPDFLDRAFRQDFRHPDRAYDRDAMLDISFGGGFPEAIMLGDTERRLWHRDYADALVERDLRDLGRIQRRDAMSELIHTLAAWSGKFMDISSIGAGLSIARSTVETYINALEALYIVERVRAWKRTDYARAGQRPRLFMTDSGLMSSILDWDRQQVRMDADRSGKLIETFMFNEIAAQVDANAGRYSLFHYRDREKREIDFLIEREDRALLGIEIKAGSAIGTNDFKNLSWFKKNIARDRKFTGIVLYSGELTGSMGDGLWAVPFGTVWNRQ